MTDFDRLTIRVCAYILAVLSAVGCHGKSNVPSSGTETNWLRTCHEDAECGVGQCLCGVCSRECVADQDCAAYAPSHCAVSGTTAPTTLCQSSAAPGLCLPACSGAGACPAGQGCLSGSCVPQASVGVAAMSDGGSVSNDGGAAGDTGAGSPGSSAGAANTPVSGPSDSGCVTTKPGSWVAMPSASAPVGDLYDQAVWNGSEMVVVETVPRSGTSGRYDPCTNSWQANSGPGVELYAQSLQVPGGLLYFETVPDLSGSVSRLGWASRLTLLDLNTNQWVPLAADNEPPNQKRVVFWTGKKLIWWGGALQHPDLLGPGHWEDRQDGGVYDLATRSWRAMSSVGAPAGRTFVGNAVWTGDKLVVWGGSSAVDATATTENDYCFNSGDYEQCQRFGDGGVYDLATDTWTPITTLGAPSARVGHHLVWTGTDLLLIGGAGFSAPGVWTRFADAYRYQIAEDRWSSITLPQPLKDAMLQGIGGADVVDWASSRLLLHVPVNQITPSPTYAYYPAADTWQVVADPPNGALCPAGKSQGVCLTPSGTRYYGLYRAPENAWTLLDYPVRDPALHATNTIWTGSQLLEWGGYRDGPTPDAGPCPQNAACDPIGAPQVFTGDGAVFTPP